MRYSLHIHRWGRWGGDPSVVLVKRTCEKCCGVEYRGMWQLTEKQLLR